MTHSGTTMSEDNLTTETSVKMQIGHLLVAWDVLANKLASRLSNDELGLSGEEQRALWALQDLCEQSLVENGIVSRPEKEWDELVERARDFVKDIPTEFLD